MSMQDKKVAFLVDFDNVATDVIEQALNMVFKDYVTAHIRRAYCNAEQAHHQQAFMKRLGLRSHLGPGELVHCSTAIQTDLARVEGRSTDADAALRDEWRAVAPGACGFFLTADRPVLSWWRRARLARAFVGDCVADMETAAAGAAAAAAGVPWAGLRAVTDRADGLGGMLFKLHFPSQAGRAADTVPGLLARLRSRSPLG